MKYSESIQISVVNIIQGMQTYVGVVYVSELDVTSSSTWPSVKRLAFSDPRYQKLLPGSRKQEIFEEYMTIVFEDERAESSAPKEDDKNILPMAVNLPGNTNDENDAALESAALKLQNLKAEQVAEFCGPFPEFDGHILMILVIIGTF